MTDRQTTRDVLIVDDHRTFADLLALAVDAHPRLRCAGIETCVNGLVARLRLARFDVAVVDVRLGQEDGLAAAELVRVARPDAAVVVLTAFADRRVVQRARALGASAVIDKRLPLGPVLGTVLTARAGRFETSVHAVVRASDAPDAPARPSGTSVPPRAPHLTRRERQVLDGLGAGTDLRAIADSLDISMSTCRTYVQQLLHKLNAHSQREAVVQAIRLGLLRELERR